MKFEYEVNLVVELFY